MNFCLIQPKVLGVSEKFFGATPARQEAASVTKLYFYDDISAYGDFDWKEWKYKESETGAKYIRDQLAELPAGGEIEVHINSRGGDVGEGTAIYNLLKQASQEGHRITGYIDGYAYSIAMTIAMACDEIHMGLGTSMFLHRPWCGCYGNGDELRAMADSLDALAESSLQLYLHRAKNATREELWDMMCKETTLTPEECLRLGFCDVVDTYEGEAPEPNAAPQARMNVTSQQLEDIKAMLQSLSAPAQKQTPPVEETDDDKNKPNFLGVLAEAIKKGA